MLWLNKLKGAFENLALLYKCNSKIKIADNKNLTDHEYELASKICDVFVAIEKAAGLERLSPPTGGIFWDKSNYRMGPFELHHRKDRNEINHFILFNTRFRDFPTIAYEYDQVTPKPDFWIRRYIKLAMVVSERWRVKIPARFGEIGWKFRDYPVNRLTYINQERISALVIAGVVPYLESMRSPRIMEIGGGAGEMGYILSSALPHCTWYNCDLIGGLVYSAIRLATLLKNKKHYIYVGNLNVIGIDESLIIRSPKQAAQCEDAIVNIPHFLLDDFKSHLKLDAAYNTYSFGEMPKDSVVNCVDYLAGFIKSNGILFEQNGCFSSSSGSDPASIISAKFTQHSWPKHYNPASIMSGVVRIWYHQGKSDPLQKVLQTFNINKVIKSLGQGKNRSDIKYPLEVWGEVAKLFPYGV